MLILQTVPFLKLIQNILYIQREILNKYPQAFALYARNGSAAIIFCNPQISGTKKEALGLLSIINTSLETFDNRRYTLAHTDTHGSNTERTLFIF